MSHWNYRVVKQHSDTYPDYTIWEVYYDDEGSIMDWSSNSRVYGETVDELKDEVDKVRAAFARHLLVLYYDEDTGRETLVEEQ